MKKGTKQSPLDQALTNFIDSALSVSKVLKHSAAALDPADFDFPVLVSASDKLGNLMSKFIDAAPFFRVKEHIEVMEQAKSALLSSPDFVGERREVVMEFIQWYQQSILDAHPPRDSPQYTLL